MNLYIFDCEVFKCDWLFIFKEVATGEFTIIHNDNDSVKAFMTSDKVIAGFNNKNYDNYILKAILADADNTTVKEINDYIISGHDGWTHPFIKENKAYFESFDLMDDVQQGISLKAIEAHLGIDIEETSVDFNINRALTEEELQRTIFYCKYDVMGSGSHLLVAAENGRNGFGVELNDNYYSIASERLSPFLKENSIYSLIAQIVRKKQHLNGGQNG